MTSKKIKITPKLIPGAVYLFENDEFRMVANVPDVDGDITFTGTHVPQGIPTIPRPSKQVFQHRAGTVTEHLVQSSPQPIFGLDGNVNPAHRNEPCICPLDPNGHEPHPGIEYPKDGGIFVHLVGIEADGSYVPLKYPTKGFPFPEAVQANNILKRMFIGQIRYLTKHPLSALPLLTKKGREAWLSELTSFADVAMQEFFLDAHRYQKSCRAIRTFAAEFLKGIGVSPGVAEGVAKAVATMFEYDNAYLFRLQDLVNETSKSALLLRPVREMWRLLKILRERDHREKMHLRFKSGILLLSAALFWPPFRRAFHNAIWSTDIEHIRMDEGDRYHVLRWKGYNFLGRSFEDRGSEFLKIHNGKPPTAFILGA